jgi:hypothetical protein
MVAFREIDEQIEKGNFEASSLLLRQVEEALAETKPSEPEEEPKPPRISEIRFRPSRKPSRTGGE